MSVLVWDQVGEKVYETGVDHGVLYRQNPAGVYDAGYAWNGLTTVTESPSGAEANPQFADNIKYINLLSAEEFGATIEAFTYPDEFAECDGSAEPTPGVTLGQQPRKTFGLAYRTKVGNDVNADAGYKLHLVYGCLAAPSEKAYATVNDSPEALAFSWDVTTTPVPVTGYKPTASMVFDSTKVPAAGLAALEQALFGTVGADPRLPMPDEVLGMFAGAITEVETVAPTYNAATDIITIPTVTGVVYYIGGEVVTGTFGPITEDTVVVALPAAGYKFTATSDTDWTINFA
jgi:hypothetical protein